MALAQNHSGVGNVGLASNYTNITIASMEDLGGGLKLDFAAQINWDTVNTGGLSNRNSHIGLVGESWGGVWYGTNENLYERYLYTQTRSTTRPASAATCRSWAPPAAQSSPPARKAA